ncbi:MAG: helix-turn-helix domain-containing protein, partial [Synergistaceae bacterium]|nr:helix-turn-helix domain-containing protein [Synergistaceae bacterium]
MTNRRNKTLPEGLPLLLTERQVSEYTGIPRSTLAKARCEGITGRRAYMPPFVKQGTRVRYPLRDLVEYLDGL